MRQFRMDKLKSISSWWCCDPISHHLSARWPWSFTENYFHSLQVFHKGLFMSQSRPLCQETFNSGLLECHSSVSLRLSQFSSVQRQLFWNAMWLVAPNKYENRRVTLDPLVGDILLNLTAVPFCNSQSYTGHAAGRKTVTSQSCEPDYDFECLDITNMISWL